MKIQLNMLGIELPGFWGFLERYQLRPAMGLLTLTSLLRREGHQIEISDQRVERFSRRQWIDRIKSGNFDLVGISTYSPTKLHHASYIRALRAEYDGLIVVGGPGSMKKTAEFWLDNGADVAAIGEGERTLLEIVERREAGRDLAGIPGTVTRGPDGKTTWGPPREQLSLRELEQLPFPAWNDHWIKSYTDRTIINAKLPTAGVLVSRGCPYRCSFCGSPSIWTGIRQRSVESVMAELDWLVEKFGVRHIGFLDDIFGLKANWTLDFCAELKSRPYKLNWMICLHPHTFRKRKREVFTAMAEAGLNFISFGAQSANPEVLANINRDPTEIDALRENIPLCRELGIATTLTYIFGLPGDTAETAEQAIRFVLETEPTLADFHPHYYFTGSELSEKYPGCDANEFSYEEHKRWSTSARRSFYLNPRIIANFASYILRKNPLYIFNLARIMAYGFPEYVFERKGIVSAGESGDART